MTRRAILLGLATIALVVTAAYLPIVHGGFIWDDDTTLTANPLIQAAGGLRHFWVGTQAPDYWPVTYTLLWAGWRLWGAHPLCFHLLDLALHAAVCAALWATLRRLRLPGAFLAAILFAVHPMNVEAVAWIAQTKTLLAALFSLLAIFFWMGPGRGLAALVCFAAAMLSKGSAAPVPLALGGLSLILRRLDRREALRLAPFFLLDACLVGVNLWFQHKGAAGEIVRHANVLQRLLGAAGAGWFYLGKGFWPTHLSFVYPNWIIVPSHPLWWALLGGGVGVTFFLAAAPFVRAAFPFWAYFWLALIPVLGFADVYFMKYSLVADHYAYLALPAVTAAAAAWAAHFWRGWRLAGRIGLAGAGALAGLGLLTATRSEAGLYKDDVTLFGATVARNPASWMAEGNLGMAFLQRGQTAEGIAHLRRALSLKGDYPEAENNLGIGLQMEGRPAEALPHFERAIQLRPDRPEFHSDLSTALYRTGRPRAAQAEAEAALRLNPNYAEAETNLGNALYSLGRVDDALAHFERALSIDPGYATARNNIAAIRALQTRR
jgi:tetratricopeptide (TPR) repeat protein